MSRAKAGPAKDPKGLDDHFRVGISIPNRLRRALGQLALDRETQATPLLSEIAVEWIERETAKRKSKNPT